MMLITNEICAKLCDSFLKNIAKTDEIVSYYNISSLPDNRGYFYIRMLIEEDEYKLVLKLAKNEETPIKTGDRNILFHVEDEDSLVLIQDVSIKGYSAVKCQDIGVLHLRSLLNTLACNHAKSVSQGFYKPTVPKSIHALAQCTRKNDFLYKFVENNNVDADIFKREMEKLLDSGLEIFDPKEDNVYVVSCILNNKLFFRNVNNETAHCRIVNISSEKHLPIVYDVLLAMFSCSSQVLRQHHFHDLLDYYYAVLKKNCSKLDIDLCKILPSKRFQDQVRKFLPYVKIEIAQWYCEQFSKSTDITTSSKYKDLMWSAVSEVYECIEFPCITREDCYQILKSKCDSSEAHISNWSLLPIEDYYRLTINVRDGNEHETLAFLVQSAKLNHNPCFKNEIFFYNSFTPQARNLGLEELMDFCPDCYYSRQEEMLVLEDGASANYDMINGTGSLSYNSLCVIIEQLAKLHASSLLYEEIMTEKSGGLFRLDTQYREYNGNGMEHSGIDFLLESFDELSDRGNGEKLQMNIVECFCDCYERLRSYRNVLCHGGLWRSNILFRDDTNETQCRIANYKLIKYYPPSYDLLLLIYLNADKETRLNHEARLMERYYIELSKIFKRYSFDLNKIYTYEEFLDSVEPMRLISVGVAGLYLRDLRRSSPQLFCEDCDLHIKTKDIIDELYDICNRINK
ncbi:hypothetical protein NQ318_020061 [Aromia moschata]|uniref:CHK kinase-like domain-containing protein n=1 Tax=Aromia moschata TaxID=1265417 RepID=A0AAV8ZCA9_9CUCU|nr:hypothetical protein NQ318_020061 [Aromia moschata]